MDEKLVKGLTPGEVTIDEAVDIDLDKEMNELEEEIGLYPQFVKQLREAMTNAGSSATKLAEAMAGFNLLGGEIPEKKKSSTHNHGRGESKKRRKMARASNKINRKRIKKWKY